MGIEFHPNLLTSISTGRPENTLPKGDINPFILIIKPVYFESTLSIAINSLKEKGIYKKNPRRNEIELYTQIEDIWGIAAIRIAAITEVISQINEREIW